MIKATEPEIQIQKEIEIKEVIKIEEKIVYRETEKPQTETKETQTDV